MIRIDQIRKFFGTKPILTDVTYHFPEGERIALVGANGAGKTTLLDLLTGEQEPDGGAIIKPARLRLGYLPQEPSVNPEDTVLQEALQGGTGYVQDLYRRHHLALEAMTNDYNDKNHAIFEAVEREFQAEDGYALESTAKSILKGLGFSESSISTSPKSLSGGWRMRLELAKIFVNKPNFLILDEPTNHLDLPSLAWVERWLMSFQGTLLFVSHDRSLLERLPTSTLHLQGGKLNAYKGNFSSFLEQRAAKNELTAATQESLRRQREHLQSFVDRFGAKATKAKQAQSRLKMISRIKEVEETITTDDDADTMSLAIKQGLPSGREVLRIKNLTVGYSSPLATNINCTIERGQKIAVIGANGIGKSTFLKTLASKIPSLQGSFEVGHNVALAWFAQDQLDTLDIKDNALNNVLASSGELSEREARALLGALLFRGDDVFKKVGVLSGGEKARVGLARLLANKANFLILDEPTNHLDLSSIEILTSALADYEGTVLFVSHDREFIDAVCTHVLVMLGDGRSELFIGKLEDYQRLASQTGFPNVLNPEVASETSAKTTPQRDIRVQSEAEITTMKRDLQKSTKKLSELESGISKQQSQLDALMEKMAASHNDFNKTAELEKERLHAQQVLEGIEQEWILLSETIEQATSKLKALGRL
jgi:ATP-binding cassette subfamily F protein 3